MILHSSYSIAVTLLLGLLPLPVRAQDPYIVCPGPIPPPAANWPDRLPRIFYLNNDELCSKYGFSLGNMGAFCANPSSHPMILYHNADPDLWEATIPGYATYGSGIFSFITWCAASCYCTDPEDALRIHQEPNYLEPTAKSGWSVQWGSGIYWNPELVADAGGPWGVGADTPVPANDTTNAADAMPACGANCTFPSQCTGGCSCMAQSSQFTPGSGTTAFTASCISPGRRKREEALPLPCPCNATYVSHACCDTLDGIVWEAEEGKLGVLVEL